MNVVKRLLMATLSVALISAVVLAALWSLRCTGRLQALELAVYDWCVGRVVGHHEAPVTVIGIEESDIQALDSYPISDALMAQVLRNVLAHEPRAVGVDIFRDKPVQPGHDELSAVLAEHGNVVMVGRYHLVPTLRVPGPAVLQGSGRVGFSDQVIDSDGAVRRALLFLDDEEMPASMGFLLAAIYLGAQGIEPTDHPSGLGMQLGKFHFRPMESHDGAYVKADAAGHQMLLDFRGPYPIVTVPWRQALAGQVDPSLLRDRMVVIGVTDTVSVKDHFPTPIDARLPGVYLHAYAAEQLVRLATSGSPILRWPGERGELLWTLLWTLLGGAIGWCVRSPWRFTAALLVALTALSGLVLALFMRYWWLPQVPPALGLVGSAMLVTSYVSYLEKQQRQAVTQLFARCVSPQVVDEVWRRRDELLEGGRLRPREVQATVLFTDLVGFTSASETQSPAQVMEWLNSYMTAMSGVVIEHGGMINKYIGDAIMAVFGVPLVQESDEGVAHDAQQAVRCALAMRAALVELNRQRPGSPLRMRIGIQSGTLVAGSLGSAQRLEYTVIGDTVNTASRLESFDKELWNDQVAQGGCRILIGEPTRRLLGEPFELLHVADIQLRGRTQNLDVFAVLNYAAQAVFQGNRT